MLYLLVFLVVLVFKIISWKKFVLFSWSKEICSLTLLLFWNRTYQTLLFDYFCYRFYHFEAMALNLHCYHSSARFLSLHTKVQVLRSDSLNPTSKLSSNSPKFLRIRSSVDSNNQLTLRTCRNCKRQFDPALNHPRACRFHTAHFGGNALTYL